MTVKYLTATPEAKTETQTGIEILVQSLTVTVDPAGTAILSNVSAVTTAAILPPTDTRNGHNVDKEPTLVRVLVATTVPVTEPATVTAGATATVHQVRSEGG